MADNCNSCEYVNIEPGDILKLGEAASVLTSIEVIPVLWHRQDYKRIVAIASALPSRKEIEMIIAENLSEFSLDMEDVQRKLSDKLQRTLVAVKGSLSFCLNDHPYHLNEQAVENLRAVALNDKEGILFWENELLRVLSDEKELGGQIKIWANYPNEIRSLIKVFNLPEDVMKELFREALKKNVESTNPEFWKNHFSEITSLIEMFEIPEAEIRDIFKEIIERGKERYPTACIEIAEKMDISIDSQEFCRMADGLLKGANKESYSKQYRREYVFEACNTYELLKEKYSFGESRDAILRIYDSCADDYGEMVNKTIFRASKVIKGKESFRYNKQGFWDIHI